MASKAFKNAMKIGKTEVLEATAEFNLTEDTTTFDLGDIDLTADGVRVAVELNGSTLEDGDWSVNADDNTQVDMVEAIPADNEINFKVFVK